MNKFKLCTILSFFAFGVLLMLSPRMGYADNMTITLESVGGQSSGVVQGEYVYPYNFSFDGSTDLTPLMCISYENEIYFGETWTATMVPVSGTEQYVEAAYILAQAAAPGASANTIAVAQWANWEFFDPNDPVLLANLPSGYQPQIDTLLAQASAFAVNNVYTTDFPNIDIFIPIINTQNEGGAPQIFVGDPQPNGNNDPLAPEPSSFILFGSGLLGLAGLLFRKKCIV
ncbi:MAG: PEP-CTERM sorting domain-containing protein [Terracidiphilus sp.]